MHSSNLDIEKFRKVHCLMTGGATEGERAAAKNRCEALARKAGLTLEDAVSKLDSTSETHDWRDVFRDMSQESRDKDQQRKEARRADALSRYRTVFEVFEPTPQEVALRKAVQPFSDFFPAKDASGRKYTRTIKLDKCSSYVRFRKLSQRAKTAIENAYPMPNTLRAALDEVKAWRELRLDREAFGWVEYELELEVQARIAILEEVLNNEPVTSWDDMEARFDWNLFDWKSQWLDPDTEREDPFFDRVSADIKALRKLYEAAPKEPESRSSDENRRMSRTNAEVRKAVLSMLDSNPELSDREISRRVGVSPQTVGNWRKRVTA